MKRYGHLYDQAFTPAALWQGYIDARRSKAAYTDVNPVT